MDVLLKNLIVDPCIQRHILKGISKAFRNTVRCVGIPEVDVQKPIIPVLVAAQPIQSHREHFFTGLPSSAAYVIAFVESCIEPPGGMAFRKGAHGGGIHSCSAEDIVEAETVHLIHKFPPWPGEPTIRRSTAVTHCSIADPKNTANQGCP